MISYGRTLVTIVLFKKTRNSKQYLMTKIQMTKTCINQHRNCLQISLENWNIQIFNLFRISIFEFRIYF